MDNFVGKSAHVDKQNIVNTLKSGLDRIRNGWCQGSYSAIKDGKACYCLAGATGHYDNGYSLEAAGHSYEEDYLRRAMKKRGLKGELYEYNDDPKTTQADIIALYDLAIELAEKDMSGSNEKVVCNLAR